MEGAWQWTLVTGDYFLSKTFFTTGSLLFAFLLSCSSLFWTWESPVSSSVFLLHLSFSTPHCILFTLFCHVPFSHLNLGVSYFLLFSYCISLFLPLTVSCHSFDAMFLFLVLTWESPVSSAVFILHLSFSTPHCILFTLLLPCSFLSYEPGSLLFPPVFILHLSFSTPYCFLYTLLLLCSFFLLLCSFFLFGPGSPLFPPLFSYCIYLFLPLIVSCILLCFHVSFSYLHLGIWEFPPMFSCVSLSFSTPPCILFTLLLPCSFL